MYRQIILFVFAIVYIQTETQAQNYLISTDSTNFPAVELNEVRVISSREIRNNKIVELPSAVSVLDMKSLKHEEVATLNDISAIVPNLFMPDYGTKLTSPIYLRGIGSRINSPSVGLYVDNVPYFEKAAFDFDFFDIERIEVLRGPQGTLYGRNTMGGILNIYTKDPGKKRESNIEISTGNYGHLKAIVSHVQPLGEKTSLLIGGSYYNYVGAFENKFTNSFVDATNSVSGRIKLRSNLSRSLKLNFSMNMEQSHQEGYPYAPYVDSTGIAGDIDYDYESSYDRKVLSNNLQLKYLKEKFVVISNTSYQYLDGYQDIDQDFTSSSLFGVVQDQQQHMFSQEITLNSSGTSKYSYLFGFFGFTQMFDSKVIVDYQEDGIAAYNLPFNPYTLYKSYENTTSGAALFHQSTFTDLFITGLDFIAGLRIDAERAAQKYDYDRLTGETLNVVEGFDYNLDFFNLMPRIAFSYQCAENINTYATLAKGYKTGGFNTTIEAPEYENFDPENSINYELGIKSDFFSQKLTANFALFYIDWDNQQIAQTVPSGRGTMIVNAGKSYSKGFEAEINVKPAKNLNLFANLGLTEAKFITYEKNETTNYNGNYIPYVPQGTFHTGANYSLHTNRKLVERINMHVSYQGFGQHYWNEANSAKQDYYGMLNSSINFFTKKFIWTLWGKNLLNTDYHSFYFSSLGNSFVQLGKPLTIGTTLRLKF